jgi:hypothetical protein
MISYESKQFNGKCTKNVHELEIEMTSQSEAYLARFPGFSRKEMSSQSDCSLRIFF